MTKAALQPLDSSRLVQYAEPIACYICEANNTFDAEYCHVCLAPMALSHQAVVQNVHPKMVAVIGASGVGKTVYLGMLMDMLSRQRRILHHFAANHYRGLGQVFIPTQNSQ
jgi:hypothetical protein